MEVLRAVGKAEHGTTRAAEYATAQPTPQDTPARGQVFAGDITGTDRIKVETGWHSPGYIDYLGQVLYSDVWLRTPAGWVRYTVDADSVTTRRDDERIASMSFTIVKSIEQHNRTA
jgi:hypothetical protein